jgi:hypothetical protein
MAEANTQPDPLLYGLQTIRLKHADAKAKAEAARQAKEAADAAMQDLHDHLTNHIDQVKATFIL